MNSVPADPMIGQTLDGRYAIRSRIARGGMAMVYLANDLRLERRVAVKVMHAHLAEDENFTRRFEQEARSAAGLSHPNLVGVFDQGHDRDRAYLVMEYLPGITLRQLLKQQKRLTAEQAMEISEAVLAGLAAAHAAGIVHRDLKPENVLLADDGRIKLGDFGLARAVSANTTTGQALLGTIAYLSPELVTRGVADARSDLYAFGIMLYEMLTGEQPFTGEQPMQIAYQHAHSEVPLPSLKSPEATTELDELVRWTTQRDPELRPRDAGEALDYLAGMRQGIVPPEMTRVLPYADETAVLPTSSTTVLEPAAPEAPAGADDGDTAKQAALASPVERAAATGRKRAVRGRIVAAVVVVLIALAGGAGWWFGQGPGSRVAVPEVAGLGIDEATAALADRTLAAEVFDCPSLEIPAGSAVRTEPGAGTRVDRSTSVRLCRSTGPEQKPVPTLVGLSVDDAKRAIEEAGFTFGSVLEKRFDGGTPDSVIAALDTDGNGLGDTYSERGRIDLIASAGPLPDVRGLTADAAAAKLKSAGLTVDASLNSEANDDEVPEGTVIQLVPSTDPVKTGDALGLQLSLGPQLFAIPDVRGMNVNDAAAALRAAGFTVNTGIVPEGPAGALFEVKGTSPATGEMRKAGTEVSLRYI